MLYIIRKVALLQAFICIVYTELFDCIVIIFHFLVYLFSLGICSPRLERPMIQCAF